MTGSQSTPDVPSKAAQGDTPQVPFLYGREQGGGSFTDAMENLIADLRGLLYAANPGQQVVIQREHIDRDGFYFAARVLPYLTEAQFKAAASQPSTVEEGKRYGPERWMVDYEHAEGEPQHAVLSWLSTDPTTRLPDAGTELVKLEEYERVKAAAIRHAEEWDAERAESNRLRQERDRAESASQPDPDLREALEFYADAANYEWQRDWPNGRVQGDRGEIARALLTTSGTSEEKCECGGTGVRSHPTEPWHKEPCDCSGTSGLRVEPRERPRQVESSGGERWPVVGYLLRRGDGEIEPIAHAGGSISIDDLAAAVSRLQNEDTTTGTSGPTQEEE